MPNESSRDIFAVMSLLSANADKNFVQRIMSPEGFPKLYDNPGGEMGEASTHSMAWGEDAAGNAYVYPTIIQKADGELHRFKDKRAAERYALDNDEVIHFGQDKDAAAWFSSDDGYKQIWNNQ
jgi:hypothetical protein